MIFTHENQRQWTLFILICAGVFGANIVNQPLFSNDLKGDHKS